MDEIPHMFKDEDIEFIHFPAINDCDNFLNFASHKNIQISHKCCNGDGCGILNMKREQVKIIIKEYLQLNSNNKVTNY